MPPQGDGQSSSGSPPSGGVQTAARSDTQTVRRPFVPEAFGKYYLLDRVAVGGMAEVFRAKTFGHSGFEKILVIKRILEHFADDPEFVEMFIDEAKLSVRLTHPNIAQILDFGKISSNYFIAMEAVDGKDLKSVLVRLSQRNQRMRIPFAVYIAHQLARGLDYAHKRSDSMGLPLNIVHRDVSPSNVMLTYEGHVKIVDFGIAHADEEGRESESGVLKGKYSYMSPEQAQGQELDHRSDLFSAGICLWEMLTGNRLFRKSTDIETLEAIKACDVPPPSSFNPDVPPELDEICAACLSRAPGDRYQDAEELQLALGDFMLPTTPDRLTPEVAAFMHECFGEEIRQERERLERGTQLASEMHFGGEVDLDLEEDEEFVVTETTATVRPPSPSKAKPNRALWAALGTIGVLLATLAVLLGPMFFGGNSAATLQVTVLPTSVSEARMTVDGEAVAGLHVQVEPEVAHSVEISAPGFETRTKQIELVAGQVYSMEIQLQPEQLSELPGKELPFTEPILEEEEPPTPRTRPRTPPKQDKRTAESPSRREAPPPDLPQAPAPETEPGAVWISSEPAGAEILIDGRSIGTAPMGWSAGTPGKTYSIELRAEGRTSARATVTGPEPGQTVTLRRELPAAELPRAGKLNVQATPGWAKVFIDGAYVSTTPLIGHELPAGSYSIRLENDRLGADISDSITIRPGETTIKAYQLDR